MAEELAYAIITPYSLHKSRTGGIIARLISRSGVELAAARMFAPSADLVQQYTKEIVSAEDPEERRVQEWIRDYMIQHLMPEAKIGRASCRERV